MFNWVVLSCLESGVELVGVKLLLAEIFLMLFLCLITLSVISCHPFLFFEIFHQPTKSHGLNLSSKVRETLQFDI